MRKGPIVSDFGLSHGVFALARTKRRRFLWCAWWTGVPSETSVPFRKPDAWGGGARTIEEARALAEAAAGRSLEAIDGRWAGAWKRILAGQKPFPTRGHSAKGADVRREACINPYTVLGVETGVSIAELKSAFRQRVLEHHPDTGGTPEGFIRVNRAYESIVARRSGRKT
jgi:hypothetical protein